jgi:hypothetical protein
MSTTVQSKTSNAVAYRTRYREQPEAAAWASDAESGSTWRLRRTTSTVAARCIAGITLGLR